MREVVIRGEKGNYKYTFREDGYERPLSEDELGKAMSESHYLTAIREMTLEEYEQYKARLK